MYLFGCRTAVVLPSLDRPATVWGGDAQPTSLIEAIYPSTVTPVATPSRAGQLCVSLGALWLSWRPAYCVSPSV